MPPRAGGHKDGGGGARGGGGGNLRRKKGPSMAAITLMKVPGATSPNPMATPTTAATVDAREGDAKLGTGAGINSNTCVVLLRGSGGAGGLGEDCDEAE